MRAPFRIVVAAGVGGLAACFTGEGTIGAVCEDAGDCGDDQRCRHEICGRCDDGLAQIGEVCFVDDDEIVVGSTPLAFSIADLEDDGRPDLLAIGPGNSTLHVLRGSGDGGFEASAMIPIGARATALAVADIDADGVRDVAVAAVEPPGVVVLWGDGAGGLTPAEPVMVGEVPGSVAVDDVRGDVVLRVAIADLGSDPTQPGRIVLLDQPQPRSFALGATVDVGASPSVVGAAFVDDDEAPDWIVLRDGGIEVLGGDGNGGLLQRAAIPTGSTPTAAWIGDLDADADLDIVATLTDEDAVVVVRRTAAEDFGDVEIVPTAPDPLDVTVFDANRDSALDLVVATGGAPGLVLHPAQGRGYPHRVTLFDVPGRRQVVAADLDRNLLPDLVTAARDVAAVTVFTADP